MNFVLTKNNHMTVGYNDTPWRLRSDLYDKFFIKYLEKSAETLTFRDAAIKAAREIYELGLLKNKKPLVLYSGGIDSEFVICAFLAAGVDFSVGHIKYTPDLNNHEYQYVESFSKKYDLDLKIYPVDLLDFLNQPSTMAQASRDNAHLIECQVLASITPQIKDHFIPISDHPGVMLHRRNTDLSLPSDWFWKDYEHLTSYFFHCLNEKIDACPSFFHWSPEIILAFLLDPMIVSLVDGSNYGKITNRSTMPSMYQAAFPEYEIKQRIKYNGFEYVSKDMINILTKELNGHTKYDRHSGQSIEYFDFLKLLGYYGN